jgi:hypothetical protein
VIALHIHAAERRCSNVATPASVMPQRSTTRSHAREGDEAEQIERAAACTGPPREGAAGRRIRGQREEGAARDGIGAGGRAAEQTVARANAAALLALLSGALLSTEQAASEAMSAAQHQLLPAGQPTMA